MGSATILVIEDDDLSRDLLRLLLLREGHRVETAATGEDALARLNSFSFRPTVILTDLHLPGSTRQALAATLRQAAPQARIVAMSGSRPEDDIAEAFDGFLLKPFSIASLTALLIATEEHTAHERKSHSAEEDASVINAAVLEKLSAAMPEEKLRQLYTLCIQDVRKRVDLMRSAAAAADDATYRSEAHAIKGGAGMVGAARIKLLAASQEDAGIVTNHVAMLDEILEAARQLEDMLILDGPSPKTTDVTLLRAPSKEQE